jgi:transcriptional antiterminator RfaH
MIDEAARPAEQPARPLRTSTSFRVPPEEEPVPIDAFIGVWWLVHTRPRNEKALSADLDRMGIDHFLPLVCRKRRYGRRTTSVLIPLFPSYLFLCGQDPEERYAALRTNRIAKLIDVADQERLKVDLRHVYTTTTGDQPVDLYPGIRRGRRCRVTYGSLKGLEGVVIRRRGQCRVYVGVDILGQSAEVEIDPSLLEVIE